MCLDGYLMVNKMISALMKLSDIQGVMHQSNNHTEEHI